MPVSVLHVLLPLFYVFVWGSFSVLRHLCSILAVWLPLFQALLSLQFLLFWRASPGSLPFSVFFPPSPSVFLSYLPFTLTFVFFHHFKLAYPNDVSFCICCVCMPFPANHHPLSLCIPFFCGMIVVFDVVLPCILFIETSHVSSLLSSFPALSSLSV